jgi:hypothetical protein
MVFVATIRTFLGEWAAGLTAIFYKPELQEIFVCYESWSSFFWERVGEMKLKHDITRYTPD